MTDGELVEQVRAGDTAAFGELVERHRGAVYRAALAALGNDADAEDIAQEALVLAYRRIDQFRGDASVRTWMISIAWRLSLSRRRRLWWQVSRKGSSKPSCLRCAPSLRHRKNDAVCGIHQGRAAADSPAASETARCAAARGSG